MCVLVDTSTLRDVLVFAVRALCGTESRSYWQRAPARDRMSGRQRSPSVDAMPATIARETPELVRTRGCRQPLAPRMPVARIDALTELFRALADPVRLEILHLLVRAET